jgi:hypothetical protein
MWIPFINASQIEMGITVRIAKLDPNDEPFLDTVVIRKENVYFGLDNGLAAPYISLSVLNFWVWEDDIVAKRDKDGYTIGLK